MYSTRLYDSLGKFDITVTTVNQRELTELTNASSTLTIYTAYHFYID